jgi:hypothetical protein
MQLTILMEMRSYLHNKVVTVYGQEDGKYFVLETPLSPQRANAANVRQYRDLTLEQATALMDF